MSTQILTGRCYCGHAQIKTTGQPLRVLYCHCSDCRRVSGAPASAFACFDEGTVQIAPNEGQSVSVTDGVTRSFCPQCGTPLTGRYDYLPNQVYVPIGVFYQADILAPQMHSHDKDRLSWLHIEDNLERSHSSARQSLNDIG